MSRTMLQRKKRKHVSSDPPSKRQNCLFIANNEEEVLRALREKRMFTLDSSLHTLVLSTYLILSKDRRPYEETYVITDQCHITDAHVEHLAEVLDGNSTLRRLNLNSKYLRMSLITF
jgi:hypothetical protein